jgi:DeoR/GlpR family transcriptional regulator of sugar metabolism
MFAASEATIRRDLTKLEERGLLKRTYGGAISLYSSSLDAPTSVRALHRVPEKRAIALAAAEIVSDGETIVLDAGTTTAQLARALRNRRTLTVITNSGQVMNELYDCDGVTVIVITPPTLERLATQEKLATRLSPLSHKWSITTAGQRDASLHHCTTLCPSR